MTSAGGLLVVAGFVVLNDGDPILGWASLLPCVGTALIIRSGDHLAPGQSAPWLNRILATRGPVGIGLISYSLYLVHWPIVALWRYETIRDPGFTDAVLMFAISLLLAWFSWRFVEQPFRTISPRRRSRVLMAGTVAIATGCVLGASISTSQGAPARFPGFVHQAISGTRDWGGAACFNQDPAKPIKWDPVACTQIHGRNGRILLWGDSFAAHYLPGILRDRDRINADVLQYTFVGCPPILAYFSYARVGCSTSNQRVLTLIPEQHIDTVVLAARWTRYPPAHPGAARRHCLGPQGTGSAGHRHNPVPRIRCRRTAYRLHIRVPPSPGSGLLARVLRCRTELYSGCLCGGRRGDRSAAFPVRWTNLPLSRWR